MSAAGGGSWNPAPSMGTGVTSGATPPNPLFQLGDALRTRYGTAPEEPDLEQISRVIVDIEGIRRQRPPVEADWKGSVAKHCPSAGTHAYPALDNSDLDALLEEIRRRLRNP